MSQLWSNKIIRNISLQTLLHFLLIYLSFTFFTAYRVSILLSFSPGTEVMKDLRGLHHSPLLSPDHRPRALLCVIIFKPLTDLSLF